ncbi:FAD-dependent oxidoreductase [[Kitasatospora] papulosa]|uniref:Monooxygenase FAD-binding protein n=1 Tax=Streptomyces pratensis (strain ATCC 33331 / IAF-45CD) TaxID=591167 RepID=A0A8D3WCJ4_STRFA|nr:MULTISPECIES: FAD-dependent oxidoreductase [Streptomyces]MCX4416741.1 FAD-dependent oxidoreductase [[Kitasatospora] papulosa]MEE1777464.1 FAD-dependent oxidoreductase [Streptomyces sp. JV181]MYT49453.1 FAD-dependent oxidoreductase [Streptomyces sp. SID7815]
MTGQPREVDVLIVGAGPAGLAAGAELAAADAGRVEILEREQEAGGIPRHCHHGGFGGRLDRSAYAWASAAGSAYARKGTTGPDFARRGVAAAVAAGAALRTGVTVTGWAGPRTVETTGPAGPEQITARAVILATGARERPRSARLIPGTRPPGVYTTGELQQAVHLYGLRIGTRAVVVGDEPVGHAAVATLRAAGVHVVAVVTDRTAPALRLRSPRVPLLTGTTVTELTGRRRLSGVALRHHDGRTTTLRCDTVVLTGDFVPDHELARRGGIVLDPGTRGPAYDAAYRTSHPGVFAVGNLLHAVERAGYAAQEGRAVAVPVLHRLAGTEEAAGAGRRLVVDAPLRWIAPNVAGPDGARPVGDRFVLRTGRRLPRPLLVVSQDGRELHRQRLLSTAVPGRPFTLGAEWVDRVDPDGTDVRITAR